MHIKTGRNTMCWYIVAMVDTAVANKQHMRFSCKWSCPHKHFVCYHRDSESKSGCLVRLARFAHGCTTKAGIGFHLGLPISVFPSPFGQQCFTTVDEVHVLVGFVIEESSMVSIRNFSISDTSARTIGVRGGREARPRAENSTRERGAGWAVLSSVRPSVTRLLRF